MLRKTPIIKKPQVNVKEIYLDVKRVRRHSTIANGGDGLSRKAETEEKYTCLIDTRVFYLINK